MLGFEMFHNIKYVWWKAILANFQPLNGRHINQMCFIELKLTPAK